MNAIEAGRLAKAEGHKYEDDLPAYLNELFGGEISQYFWAVGNLEGG